MEERKMNQRSKLYTNILQNVNKSSPPPPKKSQTYLKRNGGRRRKNEERKENKSIDVSGNL